MDDQLAGYLCCLVAVLGFGSNYIPVKKIDVKDGVFFTLCLSLGILLVGIVQWIATGFHSLQPLDFHLYKFEPFAMLGGAIWAVGNACVPFIIQSCGLGTGQLVWSVTNMLTGWATGTFGLFGKDKDTVSQPVLNYIGVAIAILSLAPFTLMKKEEPSAGTQVKPVRDVDLGPDAEHPLALGGDAQAAAEADLRSPRNQPPAASALKFVQGFVVALIAGVFMGSNFDPPTYLQQLGKRDVDSHRPPSHSPNSMDYVVSHFSGIVVASAVYFIAYCGVKWPNAYYGREMVLPGVASGILWGIAQVAWFKANSALSYVISFPIIVAVPGVMAALWGIILFGEIRRPGNLALLGLVIALQAAGVICIALSN